MVLRKDDPIYYKVKLDKLITQALLEKLTIEIQHLNNGVRISFIADTGEIAGVDLLEKNQ